MTDEQVVEFWKENIVANSNDLDDETDGGGHDWHSLWSGMVIALGRPDLTDWESYQRLGFPEE